MKKTEEVTIKGLPIYRYKGRSIAAVESANKLAYMIADDDSGLEFKTLAAVQQYIDESDA